MKRTVFLGSGRMLLTSSLFVWLFCCGTADAAAAPTKSWTLYHTTFVDNDAAEPPAFVPRGRLSMKLPTSDNESSSSDTAAATKSNNNNNDPLQFTLEDEGDGGVLTNDLVQALLQPGAWYQLKLVADDDDSTTILTTVPACQVRRSNFRDEFILTLSNQAKILSMAYIPLVSPLAPASCSDYESSELLPESLSSFQSTVSMETAVPGMTLRTVLPDYQPPPGLHMIKGAASRNRNNNGDGPSLLGEDGKEVPPPDNSPFGFIKRYWYILLPMFLMQVMGAEAPPPEQDQQQGGGQQPGGTPQQQATAGPVAAASPQAAAAGGAVRKRRGKRG